MKFVVIFLFALIFYYKGIVLNILKSHLSITLSNENCITLMCNVYIEFKISVLKNIIIEKMRTYKCIYLLNKI